MADDFKEKKSYTKACPKCEFNGKYSDVKKFSLEQINRFPKGYAVEKHPKIIVKTISGVQVQEFATNNNEIILLEIMKCPICGYEDDKK